MEIRTGAERSPLRATYVNLYPPESDAEFVRSVATAAVATENRLRSQPRRRQHVKVVDSYSCRQKYLKSYTFTRKESANEKAKNCVSKVREKIAGERCLKFLSCSALFAAFRRLLSCTSAANVAEHRQ